MCRFKYNSFFNNYYSDAFQYILCVGSRVLNKENTKRKTLFQYILCVGSRRGEREMEELIYKFQYILCVGSRCHCSPLIIRVVKFQYILCVGSSIFGNILEDDGRHVSIHPMCRFKYSTLCKQTDLI